MWYENVKNGGINVISKAIRNDFFLLKNSFASKYAGNMIDVETIALIIFAVRCTRIMSLNMKLIDISAGYINGYLN